MKKASFLKLNSDFEGYNVRSKLSDSHDGEREVYLVYNSGLGHCVLTLFNLSKGRYATDICNKKDIRIAEIELCKKLPKDIFPAVLKTGVSRRSYRRLAWMLQEYYPHNSLRDEAMMQSGLSRTDTLAVTKILLNGLRVLSQLTGGGGHYNLNPDHILLDYDGNDLKGVRIVGMSAAGEPCAGEKDFYDFAPDMHFIRPKPSKAFTHIPPTYMPSACLCSICSQAASAKTCLIRLSKCRQANFDVSYSTRPALLSPIPTCLCLKKLPSQMPTNVCQHTAGSIMS